MKSLKLILLSLLLVSCSGLQGNKVPTTRDGYRISTYDPKGAKVEEFTVDVYRINPVLPAVYFKADDGRQITSTDFQIEELVK